MTSLSVFQNTFILRTTGVANFVDVIKIATIFIKITLKTQKAKKQKLCIKIQSIFVFLDI